MPTYMPKGDLPRKWFVIDAKGKVLGKLAAVAAAILTGKRKPIYTPFLDTGDHVVVINAAQVHLTGRKETAKVYHAPDVVSNVGKAGSLDGEDVLPGFTLKLQDLFAEADEDFPPD